MSTQIYNKIKTKVDQFNLKNSLFKVIMLKVLKYKYHQLKNRAI
jgi:hypothetical protein